jgi:hypothetical protein
MGAVDAADRPSGARHSKSPQNRREFGDGDDNARIVRVQSPAGDVSRRFIATLRLLAEN